MFNNYNIFNKTVIFDKKKFPFSELTEKIFNHNLNNLHELTDKEYPLFTTLGKLKSGALKPKGICVVGVLAIFFTFN